MSGTSTEPMSGAAKEGFVEIDGHGFYAIRDVDRLGPFLMSITSDADHWMFISSRGSLTAGRGDAASALFPYETDDRIHDASGVIGPVTVIRRTGGGARWEPFWDVPRPGVRRNLYKSVVGNQVLFEEVHPEWALAFRARWSNSDRFGFIRTVTISNTGSEPAVLDIVDGLVNLLPFGLEPPLYQRMSNLTNAYKRSEVIEPATRLAVFSLESGIVDRPEPAEMLIASVAWSTGLEEATLSVDRNTLEAFRRGAPPRSETLTTGRPGAYLLSAMITLAPGETRTWEIVADVGRDQPEVAALRRFLETSPDPASAVASSVRRGTESLEAVMARADALQRTGDRLATAHHFANVTYNVMRGGIFTADWEIDTADFVRFLDTRNRIVADRHRELLAALPEKVARTALFEAAEDAEDPQLMRLAFEYLPLTFSRRHGDPSRPWNQFSIRVRNEDGLPIISYEGNWRDIFQNWEALCLSFPAYLPSVVSVFVNASTPDGFNPYRITRDGIDWEVPDPEDPWSHIGYWGDHQLVYLQRLLDATDRYLPGVLEGLLDRRWFSYADVPYRIVPYDEMLRDPKETIRYDESAAERSALRVETVGADGKLLWDQGGAVYLVTLMEKLLVPALSKLSSFVPGGGIWMNTQRPEWNDANNALVGNGVSMVTLYHLRRYLADLADLIERSNVSEVPMSIEVADWLAGVGAIFRGNAEHLGGPIDDRYRKDLMDELGWSFFEYRSRVYASGFSGLTTVQASAIVGLCGSALQHVDDTIGRSRRSDGLYHSYSLVQFDPPPSGTRVEYLGEMLEGQVAVLGSGLLDGEERLSVIDALFASRMFRPDQGSFMLYPAEPPRPFLEKNVIPASDVAGNELLRAFLEAGDTSIVETDADGRHRFRSEFSSARDLAAALERLQRDDRWAGPIAADRDGVLAVYERVFRHHGYTGRSGSMYGYEGIGSIYWHMVAKLLVAIQESIVEARDHGEPVEILDRLAERYWRVRVGLGFNKTAAEYGAFPIDPYSHTPAHAGAQQPGMTGQVKEELLTRLLEVGLRIDDGEIHFDPVLLRRDEFLSAAEAWPVLGIGGSWETIALPEGALGSTLCGVPVVVVRTDGPPRVETELADGSRRRRSGLRLDTEASSQIFARTGDVSRITVFVPEADIGAP